MARLPQPGGDDGDWGEILNEYLTQSLQPNGELKDIPQSKVQNLTSTLATKLSESDLDEAVAQNVAAANTLTSGAIKSAVNAQNRYKVYGPNWVFDGDSITIGGHSSNDSPLTQDRRHTWTTEMARLSNGRIKYVYNAAIAGTKLDQMLARFDTRLAPHAPDVILLTAGTNDVGQGRSLADFLADLAAYHSKAIAIGAQLIVGAIWPTDDTVRAATSRTWNAAIRQWCDGVAVQFIDWQQVSDVTTGGWPAGWSSDQIHPAQTGTLAYSTIGRFGWNAVAPRCGTYALERSEYNGSGLLSNGFFTAFGAPLAAPSGLSATSSTASGTLPAGTYSYRLTGRSYFDESALSTEATAVLATPGTITVNYAGLSGSRGFRVYRKGPTDTQWLFVNEIVSALAGSFTDDGTYASGSPALNVDSSALPTGISQGATSVPVFGDGKQFFTELGTRGNIVRLRNTRDSSPQSFFFSIEDINIFR